jgi:hypothetical protein
VSPRIELPMFGATPPDPDWGGLGDAGWARGSTFLEWAGGPAAQDLADAFQSLAVGASTAEFLARFPHRVRVLALASDDPLVGRSLAHAERLCTLAPHVWMRIFAAAHADDLVQRYAPARECLPRFVFFSADRREFARWGPANSAALRADVHGSALGAAFVQCLAAHAPGPDAGPAACDASGPLLG